jgi:hypothetical protein
MSLSDYAGRTPAGEGGTELVVGRVIPRRVWDVRSESRGRCANCDAELRLRERHVLATLVERPNRGATRRRFLCDERCVAEWVDGRE